MTLPGMLLVLFLTAPVQPCASQAARKPIPTEAAAPAMVLDINRATAQDFAQLPEIGPKLAQRIVAYREKHGPFRRVEDVLVIRGIGPKKWRKIRPYLRVGERSRK
ncbi:MAG: helix-hairpin-helix domain-containing protein [Acidobacteriia bacterium]|nr:helix-hairpin-helix domain-containing protein [Terriglobia bacterium]